MYIMYFLISNRDVYDIQHPCYLGNGMYILYIMLTQTNAQSPTRADIHTHTRVLHMYTRTQVYIYENRKYTLYSQKHAHRFVLSLCPLMNLQCIPLPGISMLRIF